MTVMEGTNESAANRLCKACGLCCTGHLFLWTKLRSAEMDSIEELGLKVFRSVPSQRGFNQPCPLWQGQCTIYASASYPRFCHTYKCALLKKLLDETASLEDALRKVEKTKQKIHELETLLPDSPGTNFRERLVAHLEVVGDATQSGQHDGDEFRQRAGELLSLYEEVFGVDDLIEKSPDS